MAARKQNFTKDTVIVSKKKMLRTWQPQEDQKCSKGIAIIREKKWSSHNAMSMVAVAGQKKLVRKTLVVSNDIGQKKKLPEKKNLQKNIASDK